MNGESDIVMNINILMYSPETIDKKCIWGREGSVGVWKGGVWVVKLQMLY